MIELAPHHRPIRHPAPLAVGQQIKMGKNAIVQLVHRQTNVKEAFTIQDSEGKFFRASLLSSWEGGAEATVYEAMPGSPESPVQVNLVTAVLARQRMIFVAQKATELGADRILPVHSERSVGPEGLEHEKAHAWGNQAVRAVKQCRRGSVPELPATVPLKELLAGPVWKDADARYYLDDTGARAVHPKPGAKSVCLAVGPEGGWTDAERKQLKKAGATPLFLGARIVRAETAVIVGLTLLQHWYGGLAVGSGHTIPAPSSLETAAEAPAVEEPVATP